MTGSIIVTGAAGFIASQVAKRIAEEDQYDLYLVDDFDQSDLKKSNWDLLPYKELINRNDFIALIDQDDLGFKPDWIIHLGARTDTTEMDYSVHERLNLEYSKHVWNYCVRNDVNLVYASSAATYGDGTFGYKDDLLLSEKLVPLNPYGISKNEFDKWIISQTERPPYWYGLKFFNVYGPHEQHKGRMASVIFHAYNQIKANGNMKLFRSHRPEYKDGGQLRDFVYVEDVVSVIEFLMREKPKSDIYNLGSGKARSFLDLAKAMFENLGVEENIIWIDTPEDIRDKYQYFTEADMNKLHAQGYTNQFYSLEEGVKSYVNYLQSQ